MSSNRHSSYKIPMSMLEPDDELDRPLPRTQGRPYTYTEPAMYTPAISLPSVTHVGPGSGWSNPLAQKLDRAASTAPPRLQPASRAPFVPQHSKVSKGRQPASHPIVVGSSASPRAPSVEPDLWTAASGHTLVNGIDDYETKPFPLDILSPLPYWEPEPTSSTTFAPSSTFPADTQLDARDLEVPDNFFEDGSPSPIPQHRAIPADGVPSGSCGEPPLKLFNDVPLSPNFTNFEDAASHESDAGAGEDYDEDDYKEDDYAEEDEYEADDFEEEDEHDEDNFEENDEYEDYAEDEHESVASSHEAIDAFSEASLSQEDKDEGLDEEPAEDKEEPMDLSPVPSPTNELGDHGVTAKSLPITNPFYQFPFTPGDPKHWADMTAQLKNSQPYTPAASLSLPDEVTQVSAQHTRWPSAEPGPEVEPLWRASTSAIDGPLVEVTPAFATAAGLLPSERTEASLDVGEEEAIDSCPTIHATQGDVLLTHESGSFDLPQLDAGFKADGDSTHPVATPVRWRAMSEPLVDVATPGLSQEATDNASIDNTTPASTQSSVSPQTPFAPELAELIDTHSPPQVLGKRSADEIDDPATVSETPAQQRRRGPAGHYLGVFALGAAFGAVGTIAGLMQLAPQ